MKRIQFFLTLLSMLWFSASRAQTTLEMIPMGGYTFPDQVNFYDAYGRIEGGANYGGSLQLNMNRHFGIEFMFNRMDAPAAMYKYGDNMPIASSQQNVGINYIMAGPVSSIGFPGSSMQLFFGGQLGAAIFSPSPVDYTGNTKFAWGVETGMNLYASPRIGFRLKAQLLSAVGNANGSYYFGNWGGQGVYAYSYSAIYQFGFSAGMIIGLGSILPQPRPRVIIQHRPPPPQPRVYYYQPSPYYYHY